MLFGHGPIFRDLNAVLDPQAVAAVLSSGIPVVLVPYTAARLVSLTGGDLDRIALTGPAGRWVAERSRAWLEFWRSEAGLDGFYPFDLLAAAYVRDPSHFECASVTAWVGDDALLPWFGGGPALLVAQQAGVPTSATPTAQALYCDVVRVRIEEFFPWPDFDALKLSLAGGRNWPSSDFCRPVGRARPPSPLRPQRKRNTIGR